METIIPKYKNHHSGSMSWISGFAGPCGDVGFQMIADYEKAKSILENIIDSGKKVVSASMGLDGDWQENSTQIYDGEQHFEYDAYGNSQWAEPLMIVYFEDGSNEAYSVWYKEGQKQLQA